MCLVTLAGVSDDAELSPTRAWQALVPGLGNLSGPADVAERLLLLLHYSIDWDSSWVAEYRKTYWDEQLPGRVRRAAMMHGGSLDQWWSEASRALGASMPRQRERRMELAVLLREPPAGVIAVLCDQLPALVLRVRLIRDAVAAQREGAEVG